MTEVLSPGLALPEASSARRLPVGVNLIDLDPIPDARGAFTEIYRDVWPTGVRVAQVNMVAGKARVLRGVHLHLRHDEFYVAAQGQMLIGVSDLRPGSPTCGLGALVALSGDRPQLFSIPRGVAHGYYSQTATLLIAGVSELYDPTDDVGCRWDDPALGIDWPAIRPILSQRDARAPQLSVLKAAMAANNEP